MPAKIHSVLEILLKSHDKEMLSTLMKERPSSLVKILTDKAIPDEHRAACFHRILAEHPDLGRELSKTILGMAASDPESGLKKKSAELQKTLEALEAGPLRFARFVRILTPNGSVPRAEVALHDGAPAFSAVPDGRLADALRGGDGVLLDAQGTAVLYRDPTPPATGEEGTFERRINARQVLVTTGHDERRVLHGSQALLDKLDAGEVEAGASVLISAQQGFAFDALPVDDALSHYRYLDRRPLAGPIEMGCPPAYIDRFCEHARIAMRKPEQLRRWKQPYPRFVLLEGMTGTGKTMSIYLLRWKLAELVSELTGEPIERAPVRIFRLRPSEIYVEWFGRSDRNLDRFFREVEQMAAEPFVSPADGTVFERVPTVGIIEEADGVARARGQSDAIYDRVMTTLLERLDHTRPELRELLVFWVATTNLITHVDPAVVRRCGGTVERFGHLDRPSFVGVLSKHLEGVPLAPRAGIDERAELQRRVVCDLAAWLYGGDGQDPGQIELVYANSDPEIKYRRHFMTGALVARSVQEATDAACIEEYRSDARLGLTSERLMEAFDRQVRAMATQLSPQNVGTLIEIREGAHVSDIRRIRQPTLSPFQLRRAS
ncbi:MAG: AAA family ATPase [Planctomycetota bacterium]